MPRYVILEHDHPVLHWDFMLEAGGVLRTWRLESAPKGGDEITAEPLPDHRLHYLDYEGPVSGDRGTVKRWDRGTYEPAAASERVEVTLAGEQLQGIAQIDCVAENRCLFRFEASH